MVKTIDNTGKISGTIKYSDYGAVVSQTGIVSSFKYAGQYGAITDNNGLVYLKTRYYNPALMRFMNRDTVAGSITDSQSLNRFSYVEGNPLTYVDLNGQARMWLSSHFGILGGLGWDGLEMIPVLGNVMSVIDLVGDLASGESAFAISMDMLGIFGGGEIKSAGKALELLSHLKLSRLSRISDELLSRFGRQYELAGIGDSSSLNFINQEKSSVSDIHRAYSQNNISHSEYSSLRRRTPSKKRKSEVNDGSHTVDPVYGFPVERFEADHIVPMKEITEMDGFDKLTRDDKIDILNTKDNFMGLSKASNSSKGAKTWREWKGHPKYGDIPDSIRREMIKREDASRANLKNRIQEKLNHYE